jgi:hypothetical protein
MGDGEGVSFNGRGLPPVLLSAVLLLQLRVNVLSLCSFVSLLLTTNYLITQNG